MTPDRKICWVADYLHGTIALSRLEKSLVSTPEYNRLHNVLQCSTVYLTYPSNRTSRFIHSLGCAHIAGEIFRSGVLNASDTCLKEFWKEFWRQIAKLSDHEDFKKELGLRKLRLPAARLRRPVLTPGLEDPFYSAELPSRLSHKGDRCAFVLLLQAVRFAGLLHDIGHPPFSHVSEHALGTLHEYLEDRVEHATKLNNSEKALLQKLRKLRANTGQSRTAKKAALHEILGTNLAARLLQDVITTAFEGTDDRTQVTALYLKHLTLSILKDANGFFEGIHRLVDGDIDADRIDYVLRDSIMSGYQNGAVQLDRLLKSFHLIWHPEHASQAGPYNKHRKRPLERLFEFVPSVRAVGVLEDLFKRRSDLYRQVIFHHRVVKLDALLEDCIIQLARDSLQAGTRGKEKTEEFLLPQDISGLWQVLESEIDVFSADRTNCYIQWDDAWLLSTLRRRFMQLQAAEANPLTDKFFAKLEELLSNKKRYYSLFKRADGFREVEKAFVEEFPKDFDWDAFLQQLPDLAKAEANLLKQMIGPTDSTNPAAVSPSTSPDGVTPRESFVLVSFLRTLTVAATWGSHGLQIVRRALDSLKTTEHLLDALLIRKAPKIGLRASQLLVSSGGFVRLGQVSTLVNEMEEAAQFFPSFFVFIHPGRDNVDDEQLRLWRRKFGKLLGAEFQAEVQRRAQIQKGKENPSLPFAGTSLRKSKKLRSTNSGI